MVTVIVPTTDRPHMLRTALSSIEKQTAKEKIALIIVSENAGNRGSGEVCEEFPSLPIKYVFRDPPLEALEHGAALTAEAQGSETQYVAILHDDDWWGINHIATGLDELHRNPDAAAYWSSSFLLHGESSWFLQCWNESCWVVSGFKPVTEVAKLDLKQAALACVGSGPAHFSSLIGKKDAVLDGLSAVIKTQNRHDTDRLLFLELAKQGPLLVNFVPQVFVRQHSGQDQRSLSLEESTEHVAAATRDILKFCGEHDINVLDEYEKLYEECPIPSYRPYLIGTMDPRVIKELDRLHALPLARLTTPTPPAAHPVTPPPNFAKRIARQLCPPLFWNTASILKHTFSSRSEVPEAQ